MGSAGLLTGSSLFAALAAEGDYQAMLLSCIDPMHCHSGLQIHGSARVDRPVQPVRDCRRCDRNREHRKALAEFRRAAGTRHPKLTIETGLMALDASIQMFS
jgi:hypothetical protein